jgi:tryptophanyl-tRNA synthetase
MTQFKSKSRREESVGAGLFTYPSLQAADILLYDADFVPVGEDQKQHVELTRDIAQRFNHLFGECLKMPQPLMRTSGTRIMGLDDPEEKMSKSLAERRPGHAIHLLDAPDTIREKLRGAKTDLGRETSFEKASPGVRNLLVIYQALTSEATSSIDEKFAGKGYHYLKDEVAEAVIATLAPIQRRYDEVMSAPEHLDAILRTGAERASLVANRTLGRVRERLGLH